MSTRKQFHIALDLFQNHILVEIYQVGQLSSVDSITIQIQFKFLISNFQLKFSIIEISNFNPISQHVLIVKPSISQRLQMRRRN